MMSVMAIRGTNPTKILEYYDTLSPNLQALEIMGKIMKVNGYVTMTLDKLEGIRRDLVRSDDGWQEWDFPQLLEALRKWTIRNPPKHSEEKPIQKKLPIYKPMKPVMKTRSSQVHHQETRRSCVNCENGNHQSVDCDRITTMQEHRRS